MFTVFLNSPDSFVVIGRSNSTGTIRDAANFTVRVSLVEDNVDIVEGDNGTFCAVIEDPNLEVDRNFSVTLHTMEGTAEGGDDYVSGSIMATLNNSTREVCLIVPTIADGVAEPTEMFTVFLNSPDSFVVIGRSNSTGTILDAAIPPVNFTVTVSLVEDNVDIVEGDNGTFCAVIEDPNLELDRNFSVTLHTMEGTAEAGDDYESGFIMATLTNTTREVCLIVPTIADNLAEPAETFTVFLNSPDSFVVIGRSNSTGTIHDAANFTVTVSLVEDNVDIIEGDNGTFCAVIEDPNLEVDRNFTVTLHTMEGTAEAGDDYVSGSIMATLTNSTREVCLIVPTIADGVAEPTEMFTVFLNSPDAFVVIGRSSSTGTIRDVAKIAVAVSLAEDNVDIVEGDNGTFCAGIEDPNLELDRNITVTLHTMEGTAEGGDDYVSGLIMATLTNTTREVCLIVPTIADDLAEPAETFTVVMNIITVFIDSPDSCVVIGRSNSTGTIRDAANFTVTVSLAEDNVDIVEGDNGTFCAGIEDPNLEVDRNFTVTLHTMEGTAEGGDDYVARSITATLTNSTREACLIVPTIADGVAEPDETFTVFLNSPDSFVVIGRSNSTGTIRDAANVTVTVSLAEDNVNITEGENGTFCAFIEDPNLELDRNITVTLHTMEGTAEAGDDYVAGILTAILTNTTREVCLIVPTIADNLAEPAETFTVFLNSPDSFVVIGRSNSTGTIFDVDIVSASFVDVVQSVTEGPGVEVDVCVMVGGVRERTVSVDVGTLTDTAIAGEDYIAAGATLRFAPNQTEQCLTVEIINDQVTEPPEQFFVLLATADPNITIQGPSTAVVMIVDDDPAFCTIGFIERVFTVNEFDDLPEFCVELIGNTTIDVMVHFRTVDGSAIAGEDYWNLTALVTFTAQSPNVIPCVRVPIFDDNVIEPRERFTLILETIPPEVCSLGIDNATVYIDDDDGNVTVGFNETRITVSEGDQFVEVCVVVLDGRVTEPLTVTISTVDGSATALLDYSPRLNSFPLTFDLDDTIMCENILILNDPTFELDEIFFVDLMSSEARVDPLRARITITITDDDPPPPTISFTQPSYSVSELAGFVSVCVEVTGIVSETFQANVETSDGTATSGDDYERTAEILQFSDDSTQCVNITIFTDLMAEGDETFVVNLESPDVVVTQATAIVIINDVPPPTIGFSRSTYNVPESAVTAIVCVNVSGVVSTSFSATVAASDGSATEPSDYSGGSPQTLTFDNDQPQCVSYSIVNDSIDEEDEDFFVALSSSEVVVTDASATVIIIDNDFTSIVFEQVQYSVGEEDLSIMVCARADGLLGRSYDVGFTTSNGTATAPNDYLSLTQVLTFSGLFPRQCVTVTIINDAIDEQEQEFFSVQLLQAVVPPVAPLSVNVFILDDDLVGLGFTQAIYNVSETSSFVQVCVETNTTLDRNGVVATVTSSDVTAEDGVDYNGTDAYVLTFNAGDTQQCLNIQILDDFLPELNDEQFLVNLSSTDAGIFRSLATVIIEDNDQVVSIGFESAEYFTNELLGFVQVCVVVTGGLIQPGQTIVATVTSSDVEAQAGLDYITVAETVEFTANISRQCFTVIIFDDSFIVEDRESFLLQLMTSPPTVVSRPTATVFIDDNDEEVAFSQPTYVTSENDNGVTVCVQVISPPMLPGVPMFVTFMTSDITAIANQDYLPQSTTTLMFDNNNLERCVFIGIIDDPFSEPTQSFQVNLQSQTALIPQPTAPVSIEDNDPSVFVRFSLEEYFVAENVPSGVVTVTVEHTSQIEPGVTIVATVSTANGSATGGTDFIPISQQVVFSSLGPNSMDFDISIINDTLAEFDETFTVTVSSNNNFDSATVTIINDDSFIRITLLQDEYIFTEDQDRPTVCVDLIGNSAMGMEILIELRTINGTAVGGPAGSTTADYVSEVATIRYASALEEVIICERLELIDDQIFEPLETFTVQLSMITPNVNVMFVIDSATITIVDNDFIGLIIGFGQTTYSVSESDQTEELDFCLVANGGVSRTYNIEVFANATAMTATGGEDFEDPFSTIITFVPGGPQVQCGEIDIMGDLYIEDDETFLLQLLDVSSTPSGNTSFSPDRATVVILDDDRREFQPPEAPITLVNETPTVSMAQDGTITVRVDYSLRSDVAIATCGLLEVFNETSCTSVRSITYEGLDPSRQPPLILTITAFSSTGGILDIISRPVRLGFNGDCAVNFVNGVDQAQTFQNIVFIEWEEVGSVRATDCRLDDGTFILCTSPYQRNGLPPGNHSLKVRPHGENCVRRIRRTAEFEIIM